MTLFAAYHFVLTDKRKSGFIVIKALFFYFEPVVGSMASNTFQFHFITMWRFGSRSKYARPRQYCENEYDKSVSHYLLFTATVNRDIFDS